MLYLSVQIWFWVCLSAAIGLMVGLKLQRRKTAFAAAGRPADDLARLDRELSQARAETAAGRKQVEGLKARINDLEANLAQGAAEGAAETATLNRRIAELETKLDQAETTIARTETPRSEAAHPAPVANMATQTVGLREQIASLEHELEAALPAADDASDEPESDTANVPANVTVTTASTAEPVPPHGLEGPLGGSPGDLKRINGIGLKMETKLFELGIYHYRQLASFGDHDIAWVDEQLKTRGRIIREDWVGQATVILEDRDEVASDHGAADTKVA